ncbi:MAG TPA: hypothetical protein VFE02_01850 [Candidatus Acidoferrales bacterium]|jgi:hypothetical protein|nr:hypothetical protein [Candidatus Acidoferrales bacterium]
MGKRKWVFISAVGLLAVLVGQGIYADFNAGSDKSASPQSVHQVPPTAAPAQAAYNVGPNPAYSPDLAEGDGKNEVAYNCGLCHALAYITTRPPMSAQAWEHEVNMMRGFYGLSVSDSTAQKMIQYLGTHYTPETMKR